MPGTVSGYVPPVPSSPWPGASLRQLALGLRADFAGFILTSAGSDFSRPSIIGFGPPAFPDAERSILLTARRESSRFPSKELPCIPRVYDHAGSNECSQ